MAFIYFTIGVVVTGYVYALRKEPADKGGIAHTFAREAFPVCLMFTSVSAAFTVLDVWVSDAMVSSRSIEWLFQRDGWVDNSLPEFSHMPPSQPFPHEFRR